MVAKGFVVLTEEQVRILNSIEGGVSPQGKKVLAKLLDDALSIVINELPTNIPQANISGLVSDLLAKLDVSAFTDSAVTSKLITGFVSGSGAVLAADTILQAINKLDGNIGLKLDTSAFTDVAVTSKLLTGFVSGAGTVADTDTILQAINKLDGNVAAKLDSAKIATYTSAAGIGGGATEAMVVTGLLGTDTILSVSQSVPGANSLPLLGFNTLGADTLTGVWSADPGAGAVIVVTVLKA